MIKELKRNGLIDVKARLRKKEPINLSAKDNPETLSAVENPVTKYFCPIGKAIEIMEYPKKNNATDQPIALWA
jgi:hypothetical protein